VLDRDRLTAFGVWVVGADITGRTELARHHPEKLGRVVVRLVRDGGPARTIAAGRFEGNGA
jgi:hypothetical protein